MADTPARYAHNGDGDGDGVGVDAEMTRQSGPTLAERYPTHGAVKGFPTRWGLSISGQESVDPYDNTETKRPRPGRVYELGYTGWCENSGDADDVLQGPA